jgi:hypothetical protein
MSGSHELQPESASTAQAGSAPCRFREEWARQLPKAASSSQAADAPGSEPLQGADVACPLALTAQEPLPVPV